MFRLCSLFSIKLRRLRHIAKTCLDQGVRVQNSVFECEVDPAQFTNLKAKLLKIYEPKKDSLRFYFLGKKGYKKVQHFGAKPVVDPLRGHLIL
jgi:CRISPR-associated protein Cas2